MGFLNTAVKAIMEELRVAELKKGESDNVILTGEFFRDVPELEIFLSPEPDVIVEDGVREASSPSMLGVYRKMQSPGLIVLFRRNLGLFYMALLRAIAPQIPYVPYFDLKIGADLVASKTYYHEQFHFACDVMRHLFYSNFDVLKEEALAVAWAWLCIKKERNKLSTSIGQMSVNFFSLLMDHSFRYTSPGYSNWSLYSDETNFKKALTDYVLPVKLHQLYANGVTLDEITYTLAKSITIKGKVVEKIQ